MTESTRTAAVSPCDCAWIHSRPEGSPTAGRLAAIWRAVWKARHAVTRRRSECPEAPGGAQLMPDKRCMTHACLGHGDCGPGPQNYCVLPVNFVSMNRPTTLKSSSELGAMCLSLVSGWFCATFKTKLTGIVAPCQHRFVVTALHNRVFAMPWIVPLPRPPALRFDHV